MLKSAKTPQEMRQTNLNLTVAHTAHKSKFRMVVFDRKEFWD